MPFNPNIHHRRSIRLRGYDYSQEGSYFITICVKNRKCLFGHIVDDAMIFNEYGTIAHQQWLDLPARFPNVELDVFQIMPNHMHGIILLKQTVGATLAVAPDVNAVGRADAVAPDGNAIAMDVIPVVPDVNVHDKNIVSNNTGAGVVVGAGVNPAPTTPAPVTPSPTIGDIIGAYKSLVANECLEIFKQKQPGEWMGKLWQRNYWDKIIRDEQAHQRISEYILNNVKKWKKDKFHNE